MPSIRRSLLAYFLLLVGLALGGVSLLVGRFASSALEAGEAAQADRLRQEYDLRCLESQREFDKGLVNQAIGLGRELRLRQNVNPFRDREHEADEFNRFRMGSLAVGGGVLARVIGTADRGGRTPMHWLFTRYHADEQIRQRFAVESDDHPKYFEIEVSRPNRTLRGPNPGVDLPPVEWEEDSPQDPFVPHVQNIRVGTTAFRRVMLKAPTGFVFRGPPSDRFVAYQALLGANAPAATPTIFEKLDRERDPIAVAYVQVARPREELDALFLNHAGKRDEALAELQKETREKITLLRTQLLLIWGATFAALVVGGWLLVGRGLAPLRKLSEAVSRVSEKDFHLPVRADQLSHELVPIHDRLTHTLDALQRAFEREKQAVADISHELRTPLAALLTTLDVTLRKPRDAEHYRGKLEECREISRELSKLVERIMTLAWLDAGHDKTRSEPVDVSDLAGGCAAVIRPLAEAHGLTFHAAIDPTAQVVTDPDKLREVLMNLLHNAVEYNQPGGRVELRAERHNGTVAFEVRDTGIGMTSDVKDKIFERFYRADPSRHATGVHAGLGLAIVKEYVGRLGGVIAVESAPGAGSTFRVAVPADGVDDPSSPPH